MRHVADWSAVSLLVTEYGLSKTLADKLAFLPRHIIKEIDETRKNGTAYRVVSSTLWLNTPEMQLFATDVIQTYRRLYPKNSDLQKDITLQQVKEICILMRGKYPKKLQFRADHVYATLSYYREGTLNEHKCKCCTSNYVCHINYLASSSCPVCAIVLQIRKVRKETVDLPTHGSEKKIVTS